MYGQITKAVIFLLNMYNFLTMSLRMHKNTGEFCMHKYIYKADTAYINIAITGENYETINLVFKIDNSSSELVNLTNIANKELHVNIEEKGEYVLCFYPIFNSEITLTYDFYTDFERGHLMNLAKDGNYYQ